MIRFMRFKWLYFLLSGLIIVPGLISLMLYGLKPSIDFTGGSLLELKIDNKKSPPKADQPLAEKAKNNDIEKLLTEKKIEYSLVQMTNQGTIIIKTKPINKTKAGEIENIISKKYGQMSEVRFETVGPVLGQELIQKTIIGILLASGIILLFIGSQFKERNYGICAILGMFHDTLIILGVFSLLGHYFGVEVDTLFVTAVLTILSFSIHDTVVVYDRIRESQKQYPRKTLEELADKAIGETLSRSLNNSLTIIFMLLSLWLLGGASTKWFVFALLIGTVSGTYSSTFTSVPLLVLFDEIKRRRK